MQLSNRLTFSLASLIVLMAFGMVLFTAPSDVYAHTGANNTVIATNPVAIESSLPTGQTKYGLGDVIRFSVTFAHPVIVTGITDTNRPYLRLTDIDNDGDTNVSDQERALYVGTNDSATSSGKTKLIFSYTVKTGDDDAAGGGAGVGVALNGLEEGGATIANAGTDSDHANATDIDFDHAALSAVAAHSIDATAPTYIFNAAANPQLNSDGLYILGEDIRITLTFNEPMMEQGFIRFTINGSAEFLELESASGNMLTFSYTVKSGDKGSALLPVQPIPPALQDKAGNSAVNAVNVAYGLLGDPASAVAKSLGDVNADQPTISSVAITSTGPYTQLAMPSATPPVVADNIDVTVTVSQNVSVDTTGGIPQIALMIGSTSVQAPYVSGDGTMELMFSYPIVAGDAGAVSLPADKLDLNSGSIVSADSFTTPIALPHPVGTSTGNQTVDSKAPTVTAAAITSTGPYKTGAATGGAINVALTFDEPVTVPPGSQPTVDLTLSDGTTSITQEADFISGNGTTVLGFFYQIVATDSGTAVMVVENSLTGPIEDAVGNPAAAATNPASPSQTAAINPDETAPIVTITPPTALTSGNAVFTISFDEAPAATGAGKFTFSDLEISSNVTPTAADLVPAAAPPANTWNLTITPPAAGGPVTVSLRADSVSDAVGNIVDHTAATATATYVMPPPAPGAVTNLQTTAGHEQVRLNWTAPAAGTGGAVDTYEYSLNGGANWIAIPNSTASTVEYDVTGLTNGHPYLFVVRARNTGGAGPWSNQKSAAPMAPGAPAMPANLSADPSTESFTVLWDTVAGSTYEYKIGTGAYMDVPAANIGTTSSSITVSNLTAGTEYTFSVRVKEAPPAPAGAAATLTVTTNAVITQPTNVTATPQENGDVLVNWMWAGADATETTALAGFTITWNPSETVAATRRSFTIEAIQLTGGTPITVSVQALAKPDSGFNTPQTGTGTPAPKSVTPVNPDMLRFPLGTTIPDRTFTAGTQITPVDLQEARGGSKPYTYTLHKGSGQVDVTSGDNGLMVDLVNLQLTGTPMAAGSTNYIWRVSDSDTATSPVDLAFTITVRSKAVAHGDITVTYDAATQTATLTGTMPANPFASISRLNDDGTANYPDLQRFFDIGGTIDLHDADTTDGDDKNSREVVISEILWGLDRGATGIDRETQYQFIELYNTTGAPVPITGWTLVFSEGRPTDEKIDVDQVSNRPAFGLGFAFDDIGQSGRVTGTTAVDASNAILPENIVSMYRNITYENIEKELAKASPNRDEVKKQVPDGNNKGSWKASQRRDPNTPDVGTGANMIPGTRAGRWVYASRDAEHHTTQPFETATVVPSSPFRINEIGNDIGSDNDWVELHNVTDSEASLKNYALSEVTATGTDTKLFDFKDQDWKVGPKGYVVISTRHPRDTDLAVGKDLSIAEDRDNDEDNDRTHAGAEHFFVVKPVNLSDTGKTLLILRSAPDKQKSDSNVVDVVGTGRFDDSSIGTRVWPLKATDAPHANVIDGTDTEEFKAGSVYKRNGGDGRGEKQFAVVGYTGVGYDRAATASAANGGTPGYDNGAVKEKVADLSNAEVTFSEIMLGLGDGRQNLPQWIELYNSSMIQAVNLNGWKLHVENYSDVETSIDAVLTLGAMMIQPNQTVLIVTNTGRVSDPDHFPSNRVVNLWTTKEHRDAMKMKRRTDQVFSSTGIYLELTDKDGKHVDEIGNLDGNRRTRDELMETWTIPMNGEDDGRRSSLIRVYDDGVAIDGTLEDAWVLADETNLAYAISETYYGDPDDYGTPGFRGGGPLPVSLSKFRPERLKDTGEIVIRWITESELNNAGFNILRSETRNGEFTKINTSLIAGQGTTSERNTYEWKDTSAKPNVVYYYQIQDVSLDGQVQTLRISRLKGNVTAAGKLTTTWGELKSQD